MGRAAAAAANVRSVGQMLRGRRSSVVVVLAFTAACAIDELERRSAVDVVVTTAGVGSVVLGTAPSGAAAASCLACGCAVPASRYDNAAAMPTLARITRITTSEPTALRRANRRRRLGRVSPDSSARRGASGLRRG